MKQLILTFLICLTYLHLISQDDVNIQKCQTLLNGNWNWILTHQDYRGMNGNGKETPITCNCSKRIIFRNGDSLEYFSNDSLISVDKYSIEKPETDPRNKLIIRVISRKFIRIQSLVTL
jgi:hypothetical protein